MRHPLIRMIIPFLILNFVLNFVYRFSPTLSILIFVGYIAYSFRRSFSTIRVNANPFTSTTYQTQQPQFKKDPNVIDAEFNEHKTN